MRFKLYTILLCFVFLSANLATAYNPSPITVENAAQLSQISSIESSYLGEKAWSPNSNWLAVGTSNDGVQVFNAHNFILPPIRLDAGLDVLFHPNSQILASAGAVWNIPYEQETFSYGAVDYKIFSPDGHYLITAIRGNEQTTFTVYQVPSGNILHSFSIESPVNFHYLVFSEDSNRFALLFQNTNPRLETSSFVQVHETATGNMLTNLTLDYPEAGELVFSNAGQYLVVDNFETSYGARPSKVLIWDIATQNRLREFDTYDRDPLLSTDGNWFFIQDFSRPYLINLNTAIATTLNTGGEDVDTTSWGINPEFSPDGRYIAQAYSEFMGDYQEYGVLVWEMTDVLEGSLTSIAKVHTESANESLTAFEFSADSQRIALAYGEETLVWDVATESIIETIPATGGITFIPESPYIRIGSALWDSEAKTLTTHSGDYSGGLSAITSPDERLIVSHQPDSLNVFNRITGEETNLPILDDYLGRAEALNAEAGIAVFKDKSLTVYDLNNQEALLALNPAPFSFTLSDDGLILVAFYQSQSNTNEFAATIYRLREPEQDPLTLNTVLPHSAYLELAFSPDNQYLFIAQGNYEANRQLIYNLETGAELSNWSETQEVSGIRALFSPDAQYLVTINYESSSEGREVLLKVREFSALLAGDSQPKSTILLGEWFYQYDLSFNPLSNQLVVMTDDASLGDGPAIHGYRLSFFDWDAVLATEGRVPYPQLNPLILEGAHNPSFNPHSSLLLTEGTGWARDYGQSIEFLLLWDTDTGEVIQPLQDFTAGQFSPDASLLAGLSRNGEVVLWDTAQFPEENPAPIFRSDIQQVQSFGFSADGTALYLRTPYSIITLGISD